MLFKDVLRLLELSFAVRILSVAFAALFVGALFLFPMWLMVDIGVAFLFMMILAIPLAVIWALAVVLNAARQYRN